jgi:hypothetical protein
MKGRDLMAYFNVILLYVKAPIVKRGYILMKFDPLLEKMIGY